MKEKILINARIIDPSQKMDEKGSVIIDGNGKIKAIGKNVKKNESTSIDVIDIKNHIIHLPIKNIPTVIILAVVSKGLLKTSFRYF